MADALASGASARKGVEVRLLSWVPSQTRLCKHRKNADVVKWYTRYLEVVVLARAWRFNSSHPHQKVKNRVCYNIFTGRLAQLVEHLFYTEAVGGSSPSASTTYKFF